MSSGKSKSILNPFGIRRTKNGQELSPKSLRGKHSYIKDCSNEDLVKAGIKESKK